MVGEETAENIPRYQGTWYFEGNYFHVIGNEHGFPGEFIWRIIIGLWGILTVWIVAFYLRRYILTKQAPR